MSKHCPTAGCDFSTVPEAYTFCPRDGARLADNARCAVCGQSLLTHWRFCAYCGSACSGPERREDAP